MRYYDPVAGHYVDRNAPPTPPKSDGYAGSPYEYWQNKSNPPSDSYSGSPFEYWANPQPRAPQPADDPNWKPPEGTTTTSGVNWSGYKAGKNPYANTNPGGMSYNDYYKKLMAASNTSIDTEFKAKMAAINVNLNKALAALTNEQAKFRPAYLDQLAEISDTEFATTQTQQELMNQGGWNVKNSGLAVGEMGKLKAAANADRTKAAADLNERMAEVQRLMTQQKTASAEEQKVLAQWKAGQISAAEAANRLQAEQYKQQQDEKAAELRRQSIAWQNSENQRRASYASSQSKASATANTQNVISSAMQYIAQSSDPYKAYQTVLQAPGLTPDQIKAINAAMTAYRGNQKPGSQTPAKPYVDKPTPLEQARIDLQKRREQGLL